MLVAVTENMPVELRNQLVPAASSPCTSAIFILGLRVEDGSPLINTFFVCAAKLVIPAGHATHDVLPNVFIEYRGHAVDFVAPVYGTTKLVVGKLHEVAPDSGWNCPIGHGVQADAPGYLE